MFCSPKPFPLGTAAIVLHS
jgi:glyoxylase-like metal-dependent hydrolase (beta-lactamase superfamily II)